MNPSQVGMSLRTLQIIKEAGEAQIKKRGQRCPAKKMREKREGTMLLCFSTLVLQSSTMIFMIESLLFCHFHITSGIFHLMHNHLVFFLSFHTLIALVHSLHGNPYSLTLISIDGHLHSPLIRLVDVRLSSPFSSQPPPYSIPPIVLYPWLTLMYCVRVEKV